MNRLNLQSMLWLVGAIGIFLFVAQRSQALAAPASIITVTTTADAIVNDGICSLREAVQAANTDQVVDTCAAGNGKDTIQFLLNGGGAIASINLTQGPLVFTDAIVIDGRSQGCGSGPCVELVGSATATTGLNINSAGSTISGLILNRFSVEAILLDGAGSHTVSGSYIGTNTTGTQAQANGVGIKITSGKNTVGGSSQNERNLISGNTTGILITGPSAANNDVMNNAIGTGVVGTESIGNTLYGVRIDSGASHSEIGIPGSPNQIVHNKTGVLISGSGGAYNVVKANVFGTNFAYTLDMGNTVEAIRISGGNKLGFVGGTDSAQDGNVIGHSPVGITVTGNGTAAAIYDNYIGTDPARKANLANDTGIAIKDKATKVCVCAHSTTRTMGNVIAYNDTGIRISGTGTSANRVEGSYIGTDDSGKDLSNTIGIEIVDGASGNFIGDSGSRNPNVIALNSTGILIDGAGSDGNLVLANRIGTDLAATDDLGNTLDGIRVTGGAKNNVIGGTVAAKGNVIAFNRGAGILITAKATGNRIQGNRIFENEKLGIDLSASDTSFDGVTANDLNDPDVGANQLQNYPEIGLATGLETATTVAMTLNSLTNHTFRIEFFANAAADPSGNGEGQTFLGAKTVTTDAAGNAPIIHALPAATGFLSATATDALGNTSEFSPARVIVPLRICIFGGLQTGGNWSVGENWNCDLRDGLPDLTTRTLIGTIGDPQVAVIETENNATANQVQIEEASQLQVMGQLDAHTVENRGELRVQGVVTATLGLVNQSDGLITLGEQEAPGTLIIQEEALVQGQLTGNGTVDLSGLLTRTLQTELSPGFVLNPVVHVGALSAPITTTGALTLTGPVELAENRLVIDIAQSGHDQLTIEGAGMLGGLLDLRVATDAPVGSYPIIRCTQGCSGTFDTVQQPAGQQVNLTYHADAVTVERTSSHSLFLPMIISQAD